VSLEAVLKRDRAIVLLSLSTMVALAWGYILAGAGTGMPALEMSGFPSAVGAMAGMKPVAWTAGYAALMLAMWWLMMVAMMLPSAAPMILLFAALARTQATGTAPAVPVTGFLAGYLTVWGGFSLAAVALQWALDAVALLSPEMAMASVAVGAALLIGSGAWQFTSAKEACLDKCRSPFHFLTQHWRSGTGGAWRMGTEHGVYCLGCCWMLMLLLVYGGVMTVYWIGGLAIYVLIEKTARASRRIGRFAGLALIAWGTALLAGLTDPGSLWGLLAG
jgi:predicted metal-binding membrane protein